VNSPPTTATSHRELGDVIQSQKGKEKRFFFEKKNQKTSNHQVRAGFASMVGIETPNAWRPSDQPQTLRFD